MSSGDKARAAAGFPGGGGGGTGGGSRTVRTGGAGRRSGTARPRAKRRNTTKAKTAAPNQGP